MLSAMANPKRLLVLCSLVEQQRSVGELAKLVGLSDAALSQHLSKMRALNLVRSRRDGPTIYYTLASGDGNAAATTDLGDTARDLHHRLTETIGRVGAPPRIDIERLGLLDGDIILLCSNGLTDIIDEDLIADELRMPRTPDEHCRALVTLAIQGHAGDDVTAVIARYSIPE